MYEDYYHQGTSLADWQKTFKYEFSLGELYRMAKEGADFHKMVLKLKGVIEE